MTLRILCDRCGKNMDTVTVETRGATIRGFDMSLHLCARCRVLLMDWIDFGAPSEGQEQETEEELASGQGRIFPMEKGYEEMAGDPRGEE